jgi:hypothetical protein
VPCIRLGHLNELQRRAYVLADNRIALNSGWDEAMLALELTELKIDGLNLESLGFATDELDRLLNPPEPPVSSSEFKEFDEEIETEHECPKCGYRWSGGNSQKIEHEDDE